MNLIIRPAKNLGWKKENISYPHKEEQVGGRKYKANIRHVKLEVPVWHLTDVK